MQINDWPLLIIAVITPFVLTAINVIMLARYIDRESSRGHWVAKGFILLGMLLTEAVVLMLPLDVGNRAGTVGCGFWNNECGGLDLALAWQIVYAGVAIMVVVVIPFGIFYYESQHELRRGADERTDCCASCGCCGRGANNIITATIYTGCTTVLAVIVDVICFSFLSEAQLPVQASTVPVDGDGVWHDADTPVSSIASCGSGNCQLSDDTVAVPVTFIIFTAGLLSFLGWFLFVIYGGVGLVALPADLFHAFRNRPQVMRVQDAEAAKQVIRAEAERLVRAGQQMGEAQVQFSAHKHSWSERRTQRRQAALDTNRYRVLVDDLWARYKEVDAADPRNVAAHYNPWSAWALLLVGILGLIISCLWLVHIIVYVLVQPPLTPFLNDYLTFFDSFFPLIGTVSIAVFALYLLAAAAKGACKVGTRMFCIRIHPVEPGETLINAFYFNMGLVMICVLPVVQFCTQSFSGYATFTDADLIFQNQIRYLAFFRYFFESNAFVIALLSFSGLSLLLLFCCPTDRKYLRQLAKKVEQDSEKREARVQAQIRARGGAMLGDSKAGDQLARDAGREARSQGASLEMASRR